MTTDPENIPQIALDWHRNGTGAALATVIQTWGSAPRGVGSQLAISGQGDIMGSVSGGCVEGAVVVEAIDALEDGLPRLLEYGVSDDEAFAVGLACGGTIRIMVEPVGKAMPEAMLAQLVTARVAREATAYVVNTDSWDRRLTATEFPDRFLSDKSGFEGAEFVAIHNPPLRLAVVGAVHIAQPLVTMARLAGFDPVIIDPREAFASDTRFPGEALSHDWPDEALKAFKPDHRCAVVTLSHDPKIDDPALHVALQSTCFYIGALGSTRTHAKRVERLTEAGFTPEQVARIHAPIGLDIGGKAPAEIAISVMAEIILRLRGPKGRPKGPPPRTGRMKFGPVPVAQAKGGILAHSVQAGDTKMRKGAALTQADIVLLRDAGLTHVTVALLAPDDVHENEAARRITAALMGDGVSATDPFTGRVNLIASGAGVARIEADVVSALNAVDPMITCATVAPLTRMTAGGLLATIKIISYAVPEQAVQAAEHVARRAAGWAIGHHPVRLKDGTLIVTQTGAEPQMDKGVTAMRGRLFMLGMDMPEVVTVRHDAAEIAAALKDVKTDLALILTASATSDPADVGPEAVRQAGGVITRFGMPVDPGNLLFLGDIAGRPVIGLPGCARSPALNGADWVLERVACGLEVTDHDIAAMGVGGLLKEIPQRPQPRQR